MSRTRYRQLICTGLLLIGVAGFAQETIDPVIRVSVDLIQVDATVTDSRGKHVTNLTADDFEITEDGKPQKIKYFSYIHGGAPARDRAAAPAPAAQPALAASPAERIQRNQVKRSIILLADDFGISFDDFGRVRNAMKKFVSTRINPGDLVSIMAVSGGTGALQQFTADPNVLAAALNRLRWIPGVSPGAPFNAVRKPLEAGSSAMSALAAQVDAHNTKIAQLTTLRPAQFALAMRLAILGLRSMPGRRALVLVSGGQIDDRTGLSNENLFGLDSLAEEANRAGVVIDTVDARGIVYTGLTAADDVHLRSDGRNSMRDIHSSEQERADQYRGSVNGLAVLAHATGGTFAGGTNDIESALANATDDLNEYYLIGYEPHRADYAGRFHSIHVRVRPAGLTVRSRSGFFGQPDDAAANSSKSPRDAMWAALLSPFQGDLGLQVRTLCAAGESSPHTHKRPAIVRGRLELDAKGLQFDDVGIQKTAVVTIAGMVMKADGGMIGQRDQTYTIDLSREEWRETLTAGLAYELEVVVDKPGAYEFVAAVRDTKSGKAGSANSFLEVPDFNSARLKSSSLELGSPGTSNTIFRPGQSIPFECMVYSPKRDKAGSPRLGFFIRLHHGPELIFTGNRLNPSPSHSVGDPVLIAGQMKVPESLPAGDYSVELVIDDQLATGNDREISQWSAFTLVR